MINKKIVKNDQYFLGELELLALNIGGIMNQNGRKCASGNPEQFLNRNDILGDYC